MTPTSRPSRARGLKRGIKRLLDESDKSRPSRARGLKQLGELTSRCPLKSRPSRARGLKQHCKECIDNKQCRALRGRVD